MNRPVLDQRSLDLLRRQVEELARAYTPEWRFEWAREDPGAALAELFCQMFSQTIDRLNSIPEKFFIEFLRMTGYQPPGPACASGAVRFTVHDTVEQPVPIPAGTQLFTPGSGGQNIIYETERPIEAASARLEDVYLVDAPRDSIRRLDLSRPQRFFAPDEGEELQRHRFWFGEDNVLALDCPARVEVELRQSVRCLEEDAARRLTNAGAVWTYFHNGEWLPFDQAAPERGRVLLEKRNSLSMDADESGAVCIACQGGAELALDVEEILVRSEPLNRFPEQGMACGDLPILPEEGGYCFGRRPAAYSMFYLRSDAALSKRGARVNLRLEIEAIVDEPASEGPNYDFRQAIIDKQDAAAIKPDDVYVSEVVWEYFNGLGWRRLEVSGDRNPFSCRREGTPETVFQVPEDIQAAMVNAEQGMFLRARAVRVENEHSMRQRWVLPFVKGAQLLWQYPESRRVRLAGAENNGGRTLAEGAKLKLRLRRSSTLPCAAPKITAVRTNTVSARQQRREDDAFFDTGIYEGGKQVRLPAVPVQRCEVWVDEAAGITVSQARELAEKRPLQARLEWEDSALRRCWVRWERVEDLGLAGPFDRVYELDPYTGALQFGDGRRGMVPPRGDHNIQVSYRSGGGEQGNAPPGKVNSLVGALPRISEVVNLTAMSGGTDRFSPRRVEELGSCRLRHRGRAAGPRDFEELVAGAFPQVRHVRCFTGLDRWEQRAPGHVTVVLDGFGGEGMEALCEQVYNELSGRVSCCLVQEGKLHVCPAVRTVINTVVGIEVGQLDQAADTQREVVRRLRQLIEQTWGGRPIGGQIRLDEVWRTVRDTPNVRLIHQIQVEGAFDWEGQPRLIPIENETRLAYAVVKSGAHLVQIR